MIQAIPLIYKGKKEKIMIVEQISQDWCRDRGGILFFHACIAEAEMKLEVVEYKLQEIDSKFAKALSKELETKSI